MCWAPLPWDWFIVNFVYVFTLMSGALVLKARRSEPSTWVAFGILSFTVGTFVLWGTLEAQTAYGAAVAEAGATVTSRAC